MEGYDISNYQAKTPEGGDFVIIKASEGVGWKDKRMYQHAKNTLDSGRLIGFYHYARAEINSPESEAKWFVECVKPYIGGCVLALDFEQQSFKNHDCDGWALRFCNEVKRLTGVMPLLYVQGSKTYLFKKTSKIAGLWLASWGTRNPRFKNWDHYTIHQYRGHPLDLDYFKGSWEDFKKMYKGENYEPQKPAVFKTYLDLINEVMEGKYGAGDERRMKLGKNYNKVQSLINEVLKKAD